MHLPFHSTSLDPEFEAYLFAVLTHFLLDTLRFMDIKFTQTQDAVHIHEDERTTVYNLMDQLQDQLGNI